MCFRPYSTLFTSANPLDSLLNGLLVRQEDVTLSQGNGRGSMEEHH
jgi:hypothetical protein